MRARAIKETMIVTVLTLQGYRLVGEMHMPPGSRLTDEVNRASQFLPLTKVAVYNQGSHKIAQLDFMVVNKDNIILMAPSQSFT